MSVVSRFSPVPSDLSGFCVYSFTYVGRIKNTFHITLTPGELFYTCCVEESKPHSYTVVCRPETQERINGTHQILLLNIQGGNSGCCGKGASSIRLTVYSSMPPEG